MPLGMPELYVFCRDPDKYLANSEKDDFVDVSNEIIFYYLILES